ncbi:MAG TPA: CRISPR-associated helicase Cas3' [Candidatus Enterocloster faecavium]|uniref:CRISPR-associated helicase Cas3 n=1 Tax=Candidatus Enterocloster faecavium TaxID=2838560 RepID=A0A9D2L9V6_9FIRM|nr:CRISPR-associated helicase Cas3' [Candidatus Enterocloster faecavium]
MEYIAHSDKERVQTLIAHLEGTARLAEGFASRFGKGDWGYCCGLLHDIGKYSDDFQKKIRENSTAMVDHATAGAKVCLQKGGFYGFLSYCIAGHHAGLPDTGGTQDTGSAPTLKGRMRKRIPDFSAYQKEIQIPEIKSVPFDQQKVRNVDFSLSVLIRMLYSCLVDADFLDTENFMKNGRVERISGESIEVLLERLKHHIEDWLKNEDIDTVNGRRTEILRSCLEGGTAEKGIFRLTVPTGGGKTIASLAFALSHGVTQHLERVIYVIPYTSIIEQNADVFRRILGGENVLENHCNVDYESSEELRSMQFASENWDKPVVVTTNVQFFESLFASKSSRCRKLHNIANSVIIFDEAQMLPLDYMKPCTAMMEELVQNYGCSLLLCTATQPALTSFFQEGANIRELCPRMEEQFRFFERVKFRNIGNVTEEELQAKLSEEIQSLCIVNTRKRAQSLYQGLKGDGVYHLSTTMYPKHRRRILETIRERLQNGEKCVVISTSLVEAGVDLDFQAVYRQLAGIDSMIQAAGRCNREGKRSADESSVYLFQFEERDKSPGQRQQLDVAKNLLAEGWDVSDLNCTEEYFKRLYHARGTSLDKKRIMEAFSKRIFRFAEVGKEFHLIQEQTKTILVKREEEAKQLLWQIQNGGYTKSVMRRVQQYCIQVYDEDFKKLYDAGMVRSVSEDMEDFYELVNEGRYSDEMGLDLGIESGMALFS